MLEHLLRYIIDHNEIVIQWLVVTVLGLSVMVMALSIFGSRGAESSDSFRTVERPSREELSGAGSGSAAGGAGAAAGAAMGVAVASGPSAPELAQQVLLLQQEIAQRNQEVEKLKSAPIPATSSAELDQHLKKIKELEAKLAEYEILEDDIADLSLYKEENARLKEQIEKFKTGGAAPQDSLSVAEAPEAAQAEILARAQIEEGPAPVVSDVLAKGDQLVAEFASAVESGKMAEFPLNKPEDAATIVAATAALAVATDGPPASNGPASHEKTGDDLLTEFSTAPVESSLEALDTDKMLAEVASLPDPSDGAGSALEGEADMDKMAAEATKLLAND